MARKKSSSNKYPCMVLCNGTSKRFGSNKMLAHLAGKTLVLRTIDRLHNQVSKIAINGDPADYNTLSKHSVFPDTVFEGNGPLAGIYTALEWAESLGSTGVLTVSGDTPFVPFNWARKLENMPVNKITLSQVGERSHLVCGLWPTKVRSDLHAFLKDGASYRVRDFLHMQEPQFATFPKENGIDPFFNVNTKEDMKIAEQILASRNGHVPSGT